MKRRGKNPNENPGVAPVTHVELSDKAPVKRIIIAASLMIIGAVLITYSIISWLTVNEGWSEIKTNSAAGVSCSGDLIFQYDLGRAGMSAAAENKLLAALYTEACNTAYQLFSPDREFFGVNNVYYINTHVGEEILVDETLYKAFELFEQHGSRILFAAPMYIDYVNLFYSDDDIIAREFDAYENPEVSEWLSELAVFVNDENHARLDLLGNNTVRLFISDEYADYAHKNGIASFVDFYWTKNAFIVDYIADRISENGFTFGNISSYDGFSRNLDSSGTAYTFNLFNRLNKIVHPAAGLSYSGKKSIVFLRAYSLNDKDEIYYTYSSGEVRHSYIDTSDGLCRNSLENLVAYSENKRCAEILLSIIPAYIADEFDRNILEKALDDGIYAVYFDGTKILYNEKKAVIDIFENGNEIKFTTESWD